MSDFYEVLIAELRDDPLGIGYSQMTDEQAAIIAELAKMPVICPAAGRVFNIDTTDGHWSHSGT